MRALFSQRQTLAEQARARADMVSLIAKRALELQDYE